MGEPIPYPMLRTIRNLFLGMMWTLAVPMVAAPPLWLVEAAKVPTPKLPHDAGFYVLHSEDIDDVGPDGRLTSTRRIAVRILNRTGDQTASAFADYNEKSGKVLDGRAWLLRGPKTVKEEPISKWIDVCQISDGTAYTEERARFISYASQALSDDVFGAEYRVTATMPCAQLRHDFPWGQPSSRRVYQMRVPAGWRVETLTEGLVPAPIAAGPQTWTWELKDIPFLPTEEWMPRMDPDKPRLFVSLTPPPGTKTGGLGVFASWSDVGLWHDRLLEGQCDSDAALAATAARLVEGAGNMTARLQSVATHVQRIRYVAVNRGLGMGFGYRPRKATEVLKFGYGDCKDKANLMQALLREVGITAHMVSVRAGNHQPIAQNWPTPLQFDHAILAVEVDGTVNLPSIITMADGRRLLLFDPTDEDTYLGDLPWKLQGTKGFIKLGAESTLIGLPSMPADEALVYRTRGHLRLGLQGIAVGQVEFRAQRQAGSRIRAAFRDRTPKQLTEGAARYMSTMLRGVVVREVAFADEPSTGDAVLGFQLAAPGVLQNGPGGVALMRLDVFNRDSVAQLSARERIHPVGVRPVVDDEEVTFVLEPGLAVGELPRDVSLSSPYGSYTRTTQVIDESTLVVRRRLQLRPQTVPVADYAKLRAFLTEAARADKAAAVLQRKE